MPGTFTLDAAVVPSVSFTLSKMSAPSKVKRKKYFKVGATLSGHTDQFNVPVRFVFQRRSRGRWRTYKTLKPFWSTAYDPERYPYRVTLKLPKGTFRVRASFADAAHPKAKYNAWKEVVFK